MIQRLGWFIASALIFYADYWSKAWMQLQLTPYEPQKVTTFLNWTLAYNRGAAFSFLGGEHGAWVRWLFVSFSIIMSIFFAFCLYRLAKKSFLQALALSLLLGGALGNLYERLFRGYVTDFIDVHFRNYHWPVFNVADAAICAGAVLLFLSLLREEKHNKKEQKAVLP